MVDINIFLTQEHENWFKIYMFICLKAHSIKHKA